MPTKAGDLKLCRVRRILLRVERSQPDDRDPEEVWWRTRWVGTGLVIFRQEDSMADIVASFGGPVACDR